MSFKLIAILKEALDVSWNPFEERDIKQYDGLLNAYIRDVLMMAKDRSIYSKGLKKSEIPSEVYEQLRFEHDNHEGEVSGLDAIMENFSEDEILERITKLLSQFNLKEALDVSWNPFEQKFKVGDKVKDITEDCKLSVILDKRESWEDVKANPVRKSYIPVYTLMDDEYMNQTWYLVKCLDRKRQSPVWSPEEELELIEPINEALDVSWNPFQQDSNDNYNFKVGDEVAEINTGESFNVLDRRLDWAEVEANPIKKSYMGTWLFRSEDLNNSPWYLLKPLDGGEPEWREEESFEVTNNEINEALDVSWNPYEEANHTNKFYEFVDYDYSEGGPTALVFFQDEDGNDLRTIIDLETEKILDASEWSGEGDKDVDLDPKIVEQLNQNEYIRDILRRWAYHIKKNRFHEALDVSWNPYEDHDYTVMMGKLDGNDSIVRHLTAKDEDSALLEFFIEYLGQNTNYAKTAVAGIREKTSLKNSIAYKAKFDDFFWIVTKGHYYKNQMADLSKEYRQKHNT